MLPLTSLAPAHAPFMETDTRHRTGLISVPSPGAIHSPITTAAPLSISRAPFGFAMAPTGSASPLLYPPLSTPWGSVSGFSQFAPGIFLLLFIETLVCVLFMGNALGYFGCVFVCVWRS